MGVLPIEKKYTQASLKVWFEAYRKSWWNTYFSHSDYRQGVKLLSHGVQSITLEEHFILVHGRLNNENYYSTGDLHENGQITLQISQRNASVGKAFLAAGFLILEKLIEEHLFELSTPIEVESKHPQLPPMPAKANSDRAEVADPLGNLKFFKCSQNLTFEVHFRRHNKLIKLVSLEKHLKLNEREHLLSLLHTVQKYGFHWVNAHFQSNDREAWADFVKNEIPRLSRKYFVEIPDCVRKLEEGIKQVQVVLNMNAEDCLQQHFFVEKSLLRAEKLKNFFPTKHNLCWSEKHGLLRWNPADIRWMQRLNDWKNRLGQKLPAYLLLSSFNTTHLDEQARQWIEKLTHRPENLNFTLKIPLRNYQKEGVVWLKQLLDLHCHPLLADEMGLGKTRQILSLIQWLRSENTDLMPDLILCPASVITAWQTEQESIFPQLPLQVLPHKTDANFIPHRNAILVASYSQLRLHANTLKTINFRCIVLDEAQYMKNPKSKTAHACFNLKSCFRLATTGTPVENSLVDLWTIFHFLMPGLLGNYKEFQNLMQSESERTRLRVQIAPFILRRTKSEVLKNLPKKEEHTVYCPMTAQQQALYDTWLRQGIHLKQGQWGQLFILLLRLRQICCDPGLLPHHEQISCNESGKLVWLQQQLGICVKNGQKIIIFSQFRRLLERIIPLVKSFYPRTLLLTGDTIVHQRRGLIERFQREPQTAFLISLKAGGTGITLHSAQVVFLMDPWWNPAIEQQAIARVHRLGQQFPLQVYRPLIENSIESKIQILQKQKGAIFDTLFAKGQLSQMERWQQLYDLISTHQR
ncbi:MAG: DEAD/DEAH box helicase [Puniceicoccales bacterium]|jgi:superfamily II DNA or RNA helicase|nr:DEAD/DEAH box helicase [Puniceicoccales bacterium]